MSKIKIIIPVILISIIIIGIATGQTKFSDFFSTGDEFYEDIYKAYENSEDFKITDEDKIATFDFDNFAFILHYEGDDIIEISIFEKENNMYRFSGEEVGIEFSKYERNEFGGYTFSYNGSSIEFDIVTIDAEIPDGYTSEVIKLKNENAQFVYKLF